MRRFADHNPVAVAVYFLASAGVCMFTMDPVLLAISFVGALICLGITSQLLRWKMHLYTLLLFLVISTDAASNPPLYHVLSNCHWIFALPCAWVGVTVGFRKVRHAMDTASFYGRPRNHSPLPSLFVFVFFFLFLGVSMAFTLMAILGAAFILMQKKDAEPSEDEHL